MIAAIRDHQRKSYRIREALRAEGWWVVPAGAPADVLLIDADIERPGYRDMIERYKETSAKIALYPHGASAPTCWDIDVDPYPVDVCLVIGEGHRDVMQCYGYPQPIQIIGWPFSDQRAFRPVVPERVLFAPIHPLGQGYLPTVDRDANIRTYKQVLSWGCKVTVRHVGPLEWSGLWRVPGVDYEWRGLSLSIGSIDMHDLVVARDTTLSLAVARGVAAVSFEQTSPRSNPSVLGAPEFPARHWDDFKDLMRYPYDLDDDPDVWRVAARNEALAWRERFIGQQMDGRALSEVLTALCAESVPA